MELTPIICVVFLLSSANSLQSCEDSVECDKFVLDSIDNSRSRYFSRRASCCVRRLVQEDRTYAEDNGISELLTYPSPVNRNDVRMVIEYDETNNYKPVVKISWTYPLCRDGAMGIKGFNVNIMNMDTIAFAEQRMLFFNIDPYKKKEDRLSIEYRFSDDMLGNDTDFTVTIGSLPEDNHITPSNIEIRGTTKYSAEMKKRDANNAPKSHQRVVRMRRSNEPNLQDEINNWHPEWSLTNTTQDQELYTIALHFKQASCEYNFDYYRFRISNCTDDFTQCLVNITKFYGKDDKCSFERCEMKEYEETTITFTDIVPGNYHIILDVVAKIPVFYGTRISRQYLEIVIRVSVSNEC